MGFWNRRGETGLERRLRSERPQPPAELLQMLSSASKAPRAERGLTPKFAPRIALVGAVTVVLAASLGVAGAVGYATKSVENFSKSVLHVVQPPPTRSTQSAGTNGTRSDNKTNRDGKGRGDGDGHGGNGGNGNGGNGGGKGPGGGDGDGHGHDPFHHEYGHQVPICLGGKIIYVAPTEIVYYFLHGAKPAPFCTVHHGKG